MAIAIDQTTIYIYALDDDSGASESSPDVVKPDDNAGTKRWILQTVTSAGLTTRGVVTNTIGTLADDATPSVSANSVWLTGGTTTITDFDDGVTGQVITVIAEHEIIITDGTNIFLSGSSNWTMTATATLTLICKADNKWYEIARSDSGDAPT